MPTNEDPRQLRPPYAALGVAGIVVATAFAAVATLAAKPAEQARPAPVTPSTTTSITTTTTPSSITSTTPAGSTEAVVASTTVKPSTTTTTTKKTTTTTTTSQAAPPPPPPPPPPPKPPVAVFASNCSGLTCSFDATGSFDPDGSVIYYAWSFGKDEGGSEGSNRSRVQHDYKAAGTYTVTLLVMDNDGKTDTTTRQVTVS